MSNHPGSQSPPHSGKHDPHMQVTSFDDHPQPRHGPYLHEHNDEHMEEENQGVEDGLTTIFTELVSIINNNLKHDSHFTQVLEESKSRDLLRGIRNAGLLPEAKKKIAKLVRNTPQPGASDRQVVKNRVQNEKKQQPVVAKSVVAEASRKNRYCTPDINLMLAAGSNPSDFAKQKKHIFDAYEQIMSYCIHESDGEGENEGGMLGKAKGKSKNYQMSYSQYSFAHSSRNLDDRRKFSIERSVDLILSPFNAAPGMEKPSPRYSLCSGSPLQIVQQFQLMHNHQELLVISPCPGVNPEPAPEHSEIQLQ